jgi:hypothetical protein
MADTIQFTLTAREMEQYLAWRAEVEAATGQPLTGLYISFVLTTNGLRQIIVRPSTDADLKLHNIARDDGTYDPFVPHEQVIAEYDDLGFASITITWPEVGLKLYFCDGTILGRETTPRCYVERLYDPNAPLLPFRISPDPDVLWDDVTLKVFSYVPLPPMLYQRVVAFIRTNVTPLLQHWYGSLGSFNLFDVLQDPS